MTRILIALSATIIVASPVTAQTLNHPQPVRIANRLFQQDDDDAASPSDNNASANSQTQADDDDDTTLPPVTVTPPTTPNTPPDTGATNVPPPTTTPPPQPSTSPQNDPFDTPPTPNQQPPTTAPQSNSNVPASSSFPSLIDIPTGNLDGGSRGSSLPIFDSPGAIDVVTQQQISERSPTDIGQALELTPGVLVQRTGRGQSSPFVRGLTGQQVLIMIDGVRMTNATFRAGPNQYFNLIDPNMVERIEVVRGGGSVLYGGDAIGGVINIVTKTHRANDGGNFAGTVQRFSSADLGYTGRLNFEVSVGQLGAYGGGGYGNYNNLDIGGAPDAPMGFDPGRQPASSWSYHSGDIKLTYSLNENSDLIFAAQHYQAEDVFRTDRFPAMRESIFDPQARDLFYLRWQGTSDTTLWDTYQITASFHRFDEERADRDFRAGRNPLLTSFREFTDQQTGVTGSFTTDLESFGTFSYGWDWYHDELSSGRTDVDASTTPPTIQNRAGGVPDDGYYSRYGTFLNWDVWLTERLLLTSGVRFEHITAGATVDAGGTPIHIDPEYQDWITHVGLTYEINDHLHLVGSINEGFRAPNIDDLATINSNVFVGTQLPNPTLTPENSWTYEVGMKYNSDRVRSQTFVWWNDLQGYIDRGAPNAMDLLERTNTDAYLYGVESSAELLITDTCSVYGNVWYTYGENVTNDEPLSRIPPLQGVLGVRRRWNQGRNWFDLYTVMADKQNRLSARDRSDVNRIPAGGTPGYATLNARFGWRFANHQRISLLFENMFDEQYRVHGSGSDAPGIGTVLTYEILR